MADKEIHVQQVLKRFPPGDRWTPVDSEELVFSSLTEGIEWVFQSTQARDYLIKAAEGKVYVYTEEETISAEGETKEEIENFIDALPISAMNQIRDYFEKMPLVEYVVDYKCNEEGCGHENKISINGAEHFFV